MTSRDLNLNYFWMYNLGPSQAQETTSTGKISKNVTSRPNAGPSRPNTGPLRPKAGPGAPLPAIPKGKLSSKRIGTKSTGKGCVIQKTK